MLRPVDLRFERFNGKPQSPADCDLNASKMVNKAELSLGGLIRWWETQEKARRCFEAVVQYELANGFAFDWVVRLRPDIWFFGSVPPYCQLSRSSVSLPRGVVLCAGRCVNDHLAWVPRPLARAFFNLTESHIRSCHGHRLVDAFVEPPQFLLWQMKISSLAWTHPPPVIPYALLRACSTDGIEATPICARWHGFQGGWPAGLMSKSEASTLSPNLGNQCSAAWTRDTGRTTHKCNSSTPHHAQPSGAPALVARQPSVSEAPRRQPPPRQRLIARLYVIGQYRNLDAHLSHLRLLGGPNVSLAAFLATQNGSACASRASRQLPDRLPSVFSGGTILPPFCESWLMAEASLSPLARKFLQVIRDEPDADRKGFLAGQHTARALGYSAQLYQLYRLHELVASSPMHATEHLGRAVVRWRPDADLDPHARATLASFVESCVDYVTHVERHSVCVIPAIDGVHRLQAEQMNASSPTSGGDSERSCAISHEQTASGTFVVAPCCPASYGIMWDGAWVTSTHTLDVLTRNEMVYSGSGGASVRLCHTLVSVAKARLVWPAALHPKPHDRGGNPPRWIHIRHCAVSPLNACRNPTASAA